MFFRLKREREIELQNYLIKNEQFYHETNEATAFFHRILFNNIIIGIVCLLKEHRSPQATESKEPVLIFHVTEDTSSVRACMRTFEERRLVR